MTDVLVLAEQLRAPVSGGIGTYTRGLLAGLRRMRGEAPRVTCYASRRPRGAGVDSVAACGFPLIKSRLSHRALVAAWTWRLSGVPRKRDKGWDALHAPSLAFPSSRDVPLAVVVNDLAWRQVPGSFTRHGISWHEKRLRVALKRASVVIVPSEATAGLVEDAARSSGAGISGLRVEVVTYGVDHLPPFDPDVADKILDRLGVDGAYFVCVGTLEPRKNLPRAFEAFGRARRRLGEDWKLVVVGPQGWGEAANVADLPEGVVAAGAVAPEVLSALYGRAAAAVYVPLLEGWGLPAVEAMGAGTPVVASPVPSVGDAALVVDPKDVEEIADAMVAVATDSALRSGLVERGRARVAPMTWLECARRHVEIWESM